MAGSIPARAGEPRHQRPRGPSRPVYPRACGGTYPRRRLYPRRRGLSPRVRGTRQTTRRSRSCAGLSPRVRGNPPDDTPEPELRRSIPARAGEPAGNGQAVLRSGVYPRACGGTTWIGHARHTYNGLSPRVRGNRNGLACRAIAGRSIPARAGEPRLINYGRRSCTVYPRACGGTRLHRFFSVPSWGLSPRVRGNHIVRQMPTGSHRSIPARAGEPISTGRASSRGSVYPRACGGTHAGCGAGDHHAGLSPRVRGNLGGGAEGSAPAGSIPARAGEPRKPAPPWRR